MAKNRVLGKGLSALIQNAEPRLATGAREIYELPVEALAFNPDQPRKTFNKTKLEELAASLKDVGVLQPVLVRALRGGELVAPVRAGAPTPDYIVVAGERRVRAAALAGLATVPAVTCSFEETEALRVALLENIQRENLGPIEEATAYQGLLEAQSGARIRHQLPERTRSS